MYLLDTNIIILAFAGSKDEQNFLSRIAKSNKLVLSVINVAEFLARSDADQNIYFTRLMEKLKVLSINQKVAILAAEYRKEMMRKSEKNILVDCFLAAQAKLYKLTLVTNNRTDFPMTDIKVITPV